MKLREYQRRTVDQIRRLTDAWPADLCVQGPTGCGKSVMMAELLTDPVPQMVLTHRRVLLDQLSRVLTSCGVRHGIRAAGRKADPRARVQLAMVQTEHARVFDAKVWQSFECRRLHIDEIHAIKSKMAQRIIQEQKKQGRPSVIGWTATPRQVGHLCDMVVVAATVPELISQGHLVRPVFFTPDGPDCDQLEAVRRTISNDFSPASLARVWKPRVIFGRVVEHLKKLNPELLPTVLFAGGVPDSLWFAQQLTHKGIPAAHIDAKQIWREWGAVDSTPENREALFDDMRAGRIKVVCNRFVLREGWDFPDIRHAILATAFGSRTAFVQACGRGLRPSHGKSRCVFQDHGANAWRFPALDDDRPWSMVTPEREQQQQRVDELREGKEPQPIVCSQCSAQRFSGAECPECGYRGGKSSRMVVQVNGQLRRVSAAVFARRRRRKSPTAADVWVSMFWGFRKWRPNHTMEQAYKATCVKVGHTRLPRTCKFMPLPGNESLWKKKVQEVSFDDLRR